MAAKVYHIRLEDEAVLSAYDYVKAFYPNEKLDTPAKVVAHAFRMGMAGLRSSDVLPTYPTESLNARLMKCVGVVEEGRKDTGVPLGVAAPASADSGDEVPDEETEVDHEKLALARQALRKQIAEHVEKVTKPDVALSDAFEPDASMIPDVEFEIDIERVTIAPMQYIERLHEEVPMDEYLAKAVKGDDWKYTLAVRMCYATLDPDMWGTVHAKSIVNRLLKHIKDEWEHLPVVQTGSSPSA